MSALTEALRALCEKHSLTNLSIECYAKSNLHFVSYAHWNKAACVQGRGNTAEDALANAITAANAARNAEVEIPALTLGDVL
jgi:hypothetical protein